jgi:hypothetical protein
MRQGLAYVRERAHEYPIGILTRGDFLVVVSGIKELKEKKRTIFALVAASVISLVVWGLVLALNVR